MDAPRACGVSIRFSMVCSFVSETLTMSLTAGSVCRHRMSTNTTKNPRTGFTSNWGSFVAPVYLVFHGLCTALPLCSLALQHKVAMLGCGVPATLASGHSPECLEAAMSTKTTAGATAESTRHPLCTAAGTPPQTTRRPPLELAAASAQMPAY